MTDDQINAEYLRMEALMNKLPQVLINVRDVNRAAVATNTELQKAVAAASERLGTNGRVLLRPSGTEPLVRVMVEAPEHETCEKYVQQVVDVIKAKGYAI